MRTGIVVCPLICLRNYPPCSSGDKRELALKSTCFNLCLSCLVSRLQITVIPLCAYSHSERLFGFIYEHPSTVLTVLSVGGDIRSVDGNLLCCADYLFIWLMNTTGSASTPSTSHPSSPPLPSPRYSPFWSPSNPHPSSFYRVNISSLLANFQAYKAANRNV